VTTWEYHKPDNKDDPCDASADGYGDQTIKFTAGGDFAVTFVQPTKKQPNLFGSQGRPVVTPGRVAVAAKAERNGEFAVHLEDIDQNKCKGENGGGVDPGTEQPKDCGMRQGVFVAEIYFHFGLGADDVYVPLPGGIPPEKNRLKVSGTDTEWRGLNGKRESSLGSTYAKCPFMLEDARVEDTGLIFASAAKVNESLLFNKKRKRITVSGSTIAKRGSGYSTGQTIIAWNLRLTRVK
jgi:hypothetical protein